VKEGPQNYSKWHNETFEALVQQMNHELDPAKRKTMIRQAEAIMEQDPPLLPIAWEKMNDAWYTYRQSHTPAQLFWDL
jgi:ABC-type transport system substrate-binding protein